MKHCNIILANCVVNNGNKGCVALTFSAMALLDELLDSYGCSYNFYLPQSGYSQNKEWSFSVGDRFIKYYSIRDFRVNSIKGRVADFISDLQNLKNAKSRKKLLKKIDCVLDVGQGDSFADIYGKKRFDYINKTYSFAKKNGIPYCLLPQTIGPFKNTEILARACATMNYSSSVMARDRQSLEYVREVAPSANVIETIDVAFFMPYKKKSFSPDFIHVGINVSALLWNGGYTQDNQFELTVDYQKLIRSIIDYFVGMNNVKVHLVPHVVSASHCVENDYEVCFDLCEEFGNRVELAPFFLDPMVAKGYIAGMDFFMGARMHSTIGAFSSGVPVIPMAYSRKFNGLFKDTLNYEHMVDMKSENIDAIVERIKDAFANRDRLKLLIEERNSGVVQERKNIIMENLSILLGLRT